MTGFAFNIVPPNQVTGLVGTAGVRSVELSWNSVPDCTYQVWSSSTNDVGTASLHGSTNATTYIAVGVVTPVYFWVRAIGLGDVEGPFSQTYSTSLCNGAQFNDSVLEIAVSTLGSTTVSIDQVTISVTYVDAGVPTTLSNQPFTTTLISDGSFGGVAWSNPDNARINDGSYATSAIAFPASAASEILTATLADIGVPDSAGVDVVSIQVNIDGKATDGSAVVWTVGIYDPVADEVISTIDVPPFAGDDVDEIVSGSVGSVGGGLEISTLDRVTAGDTVAVQPTSASGFSAGGGSATPAISSYDTWYTTRWVTFTASNSLILNYTGILLLTVSGVSVSSLQQAAVEYRVRLYDDTIDADVFGGTTSGFAYINSSGTAFAPANTLVNVGNTFLSTAGGLLVPGHDYVVYLEVRKTRTNSSDTISVSIVGSGGSVSAASL